MQLADTQLPNTVIFRDSSTHPYLLRPLEAFEASRALRGSILRQEIYGLDGSAKQPLPYSIVENNFLLNLFQPRGTSNRHAVFMKLPLESAKFYYERYTLTGTSGQTVCSPRVSHDMKFAYDAFGNLLKSVTIAYGQRIRDPDPDNLFTSTDVAKQTTPLFTYEEHDYSNPIAQLDNYRNPLECEHRVYEVRGITATGMDPSITNLYSVASLESQIPQASDGLHDLPFEDWEGVSAIPGVPYRRLIKQSRTLYQENDFSAVLPIGTIESRALVFQTYNLAFTTQLVTDVFQTKISGSGMMTECGYMTLGDSNWWIPSGIVFYSPNPSDTAAQQLQYALDHFFLPQRFRDPFYTPTFNTERVVQYDTYSLLVQQTIDPLGNRTTAGQRDVLTNALDINGIDYRLLMPTLIMGPNQNVAAFSFDILGFLAGTAVMGKPGQNVGDSLQGFLADLSQSTITAYFNDPVGQAPALLCNATSRSVYNVWAYYQTKGNPNPDPPVTAKLSRQTHISDLTAGATSQIQQTISYSDGLGRAIQSKVLTDPGPVPQRNSTGQIILGKDGLPLLTTNSVTPRWVGTGWVVFNNKNLPVRKFEPFFTDRSAFEFDVKIGTSPVLAYDPVDRVVMVLNANSTWSKVVFSPWEKASWDLNDTVLIGDPTTDVDVGGYFARLPPTDYRPTWYAARQAGSMGLEQQQCAQKTAVHANTPTVAHFDPLGRVFMTVDDNRFKYSNSVTTAPATEQFYAYRTDYDIQSNIRRRFDAQGRQVCNDAFDVINQVINHSSMESGQRWILPDILGKSRFKWDDRGYRFHDTLDQLQRRLQKFQALNNGSDIMLEQLVYGESQSTPETNNVRLKVVERFDQAGIVVSDLYDFKGNSLTETRTLSQGYDQDLDWNGTVPLDSGSIFTSSNTYNALNSITSSTLPDSTVVNFTYNLESRLKQVQANLQGSSVATTYVSTITYDAKGQRLSINYGNGTTTAYGYDSLTNRLVKILTQRNAQLFPSDCPQPPVSGWPGCQIQSLSYTIDPAGNITNITDNAQQAIFFRNKRVEPSNDYIYDSVYRLIEATGREQLGQAGNTLNAPTPSGPFGRQPSSNDGNALGTYLERYSYDSASNFLSLQHLGADPSNPGWTRFYNYKETSQLQPSVVSNRLSSTAVGSLTEKYDYDSDAGLHGNITSMPYLSLMKWDSREQLRTTSKQNVTNGGTPETTFYVYDMSGQRVRKVTENYAAPGATTTRKSQTVYIGAFEAYSQYATDGAENLVRNTVHIEDNKATVALVETQRKGEVTDLITRYQFGNHLGSVLLELDDSSQIITYEEYSPYGDSTYFAIDIQKRAPKRYRYMAKERDQDETAFYYYGRRYYACWLGRWTSCDPAGYVDGLNLYTFVTSNPVRSVDERGTETVAPPATKDDSVLLSKPRVYGFKPKLRPPPTLELQHMDPPKWQPMFPLTMLQYKSPFSVDLKLPPENPGLGFDPKPYLRPPPRPPGRPNPKPDLFNLTLFKAELADRVTFTLPGKIGLNQKFGLVETELEVSLKDGPVNPSSIFFSLKFQRKEVKEKNSARLNLNSGPSQTLSLDNPVMQKFRNETNQGLHLHRLVDANNVLDNVNNINEERERLFQSRQWSVQLLLGFPLASPSPQTIFIGEQQMIQMDDVRLGPHPGIKGGFVGGMFNGQLPW